MLTAHITLKPLASRTRLTGCMGAKLLFLITPFYRIQLCPAGDSFVLMLLCSAMCNSQCGYSTVLMLALCKLENQPDLHRKFKTERAA